MQLENTLVGILTLLWWVVHLLIHEFIDGENKYIRTVWWIGIIVLPITGTAAFSNPTGLLNTFTMLMFFAIIGMWVLTGLAIWMSIFQKASRVRNTVPIDIIV